MSDIRWIAYGVGGLELGRFTAPDRDTAEQRARLTWGSRLWRVVSVLSREGR